MVVYSRHWPDVLEMLRKVEKEMTTKTIGQVLYEADNIGRERYMKPYDTLCESTRQEFEASASAVAAVVREQCAQAAWAHYMDECRRKIVPPAEFGGWCAASAIRSMK